ncbi:hypothetical protein TWF569_003491 [Orbilia oligospora]|nr:hypothetical protein TWF569_003491 [Orbilia oligospora]
MYRKAQTTKAKLRSNQQPLYHQGILIHWTGNPLPSSLAFDPTVNPASRTGKSMPSIDHGLIRSSTILQLYSYKLAALKKPSASYPNAEKSLDYVGAEVAECHGNQ